MTATVSWFHSQKRFGYIDDAEGRKLLFRFADVQFGDPTLRKRDRVAFESDECRLVPRAIKVGRIAPLGKAV
jgi:cold shock CspA family protein